ncbi:MAG: UvrD-helicase domain-containing protein [Patescibacteria group bacterium]|nr:UvrD-helicase domain-containing protein [Patescibacteria group bacterium]
MIDRRDNINQSGPKSVNLSPIQREAIEYGEGPLLIGAGAGSGKTRTLTQRVIHLIRRGVPPEWIVAITFTNKAADEIKRRIYAELPPQKVERLPFLGTFHSFGSRILREEAETLGRTARFTIFDENDSLRAVKKVLLRLDVNTLRHPASKTVHNISRAKTELINPGELKEEDEAIFAAYEVELRANNAFDFDDLIEKPVRLFQNNPPILEKHLRRYSYILVDEFQDVNHAEYILVKLLASSHRNLNVVGDDQQCLIKGTIVVTAHGPRKIENIKAGDLAVTATGNGMVADMYVSQLKKFRYRGPIVKITTRGGRIVCMTPNHITFSKLQLTNNIFYVYLMYRKDKGFRVGMAKGVRIGARGEESVGLLARSAQEKADKMWVIRICKNKAEAEYYEFYYAFKYGVPTVVFDTSNRKMLLTQSYINKLYKRINTKKRGVKLMDGELLYFGYPHWVPQGTIRHSSRRLRLRLAMFDGRRHSVKSPWGANRLSVNTKDLTLKKKVEGLGLKTRRGKSDDWRLEISSLDYGKLEKMSDGFRRIDAEIEVVKTACLTAGKRMLLQPASHIRPTMSLAVFDKHGRIIEDVVKDVSIEEYDGLVYDINIKNTHNYIANGVVVHNSIYGFRGADFRNFLDFEKDWPEVKVVNLGENYRSSGSIVRASYGVIKNNRFQRPKELWTSNEEGAPICDAG